MKTYEMKILMILVFIGFFACAPKGEPELQKIGSATESEKLLTESMSDPSMTLFSGTMEMDLTFSVVKSRENLANIAKELPSDFEDKIAELKESQQARVRLESLLEDKIQEQKALSDKLLSLSNKETDRIEEGKTRRALERTWEWVTFKSKDRLMARQQSLEEEIKKTAKDLSDLKSTKSTQTVEFSLMIYESPKNANEKAKFIKKINGNEEVVLISDKDISYDSVTKDLKCVVNLKESKEHYLLFTDSDSKMARVGDDEKSKEISIRGLVYKGIKHGESEYEYFAGVFEMVNKVNLNSEKKEEDENVDAKKSKSESKESATDSKLTQTPKDMEPHEPELTQSPTHVQNSVEAISEKNEEHIQKEIKDLEDQLFEKTGELTVVEEKLLKLSEEEDIVANGGHVYKRKFYQIYRYWTGNDMESLTKKQADLDTEVKAITKNLAELNSKDREK